MPAVLQTSASRKSDGISFETRCDAARDLYAFPKPGEAGQSILILNVHHSAVVNPSEPRGLPMFFSNQE
jgi:hypothetical protein